MKSSSRAIQFTFPAGQLLDLLTGRASIAGIPEGARLRAFFHQEQRWRENAEDPEAAYVLSVEHASFPVVQPGCRIPCRTAVIKTQADNQRHNPTIEGAERNRAAVPRRIGAEQAAQPRPVSAPHLGRKPATRATARQTDCKVQRSKGG